MKKIKLHLIISLVISSLIACSTEEPYTEKDLKVEFGGTSITMITSTSAQLNCNISNNMQTISSSGFCIDKNKDLTINNTTLKYDFTGANEPSSSPIAIGYNLKSLEAATQYYVRPYVKIGTDISYGQVVSFKTLSSNSGEVKTLPIVFHIIYNDKSNPSQYIPASTIKTVFDRCNAMFRNSNNNPSGIDTKIELALAQYDNNGLLMKEPGIDRIQSNEILYELTYFSKSRKESIAEMWDPSNYINIWIFLISDKENVVGMSYIAYCSSEHQLAGLITADEYFNNFPKYAHGIFMSNKFISDMDVFSSSLTHEIGHYLGLHHVFGDDKCSTVNDYCDDTNTYIRKDYERGDPQSRFKDLFLRKDCLTSQIYEATNYMDYNECRFTIFTPNQISRMNHVLKYSPLVPGAKHNANAKSTSTTNPKARLM